MMTQSEHIALKGSVLTEQEKKSFGWDMSSFARRMEERLRKIRGEENGDDSFLARHHYYKNSNSIA